MPRLLCRTGLTRLAALTCLVPALLLSACGGDGADASESTTSETVTSDLGAVEVAGAFGERPTVEVPTPFSVEGTERVILSEGDGEHMTTDQRVTVEYLGVNGRTGEEFDSSDYGEGPGVSFTLDGGVIPGFATGLEGVPVGSRVLVAVAPDDGYGPAGGVPEAGIEPDDTLLFVIDVESARNVLSRAEGEPVEPPPGLPTVALAEDGSPTITVPEGEPPTDLVMQPLIKGDGPVVEAGQTITVHYTGVTWPGGEVFDSTWERGAPAQFPIGVGQVIEGWDVGLVGQTVGSQVLLVIPPDLGYGEQGQPSAGIEGTDTLVFVVDILDAA